MKKELDGIFLFRIEVWRLDKKAFDFVVARSRKPKGLERGHRDSRKNCMIEIGELRLTLFNDRALASLRLDLAARIGADFLGFESCRAATTSAGLRKRCPKNLVRKPN